jgi:Fur family ferric uptake transcriptional regulator
MRYRAGKTHQSDDLREVLRDAGLRATHGRMLLINILKKSKHPLAIKDVMKRLPRGKLNQVTVYRILDALHNEGLVRMIDLRHGHVHYEIAGPSPSHHHHHVICTKCDRIEDFKGCNYKKLAKGAIKQASSFSKVEHHSFELFGVCKSCDKK